MHENTSDSHSPQFWNRCIQSLKPTLSPKPRHFPLLMFYHNTSVNKAYHLRQMEDGDKPGISISYGKTIMLCNIANKYFLAKRSVYGREKWFHLSWMWRVLLKNPTNQPPCISNSTNVPIWPSSLNMEFTQRKLDLNHLDIKGDVPSQLCFFIFQTFSC